MIQDQKPKIPEDLLLKAAQRRLLFYVFSGLFALSVVGVIVNLGFVAHGVKVAYAWQVWAGSLAGILFLLVWYCVDGLIIKKKIKYLGIGLFFLLLSLLYVGYGLWLFAFPLPTGIMRIVNIVLTAVIIPCFGITASWADDTKLPLI